MLITRRHPIDWYTNKLDRGEPFTSLLYGDGELMCAARMRTGDTLQNGEVVTKELEDEIITSLDDPPEGLVRGTDLSLIKYDSYKGQDKESVVALGKAFAPIFEKHPNSQDWVDGVVWEDTVRAGGFGPVFRSLQHRDVVMIGNPALWGNQYLQPIISPRAFISIPTSNACAFLTKITENVLEVTSGSNTVYLVCCGLGAIPLIRRLRGQLPKTCTFLDLGSTFDVFAGLGAERGWRQELYANKKALDELITANLCNLRGIN